MGGNDGGGVGDDKQGDFLGPEDAEIFENQAKWTKTMFCLGIQSGSRILRR